MSDIDSTGAESIREIERLVKAANTSEVLDVKGERKGVYFIVGPTGVVEKKIADPDWHSETLETPAELRSFIEDQKQDRSSVFIADAVVIFVRDLEDRRDRAYCNLIESEPYRWLKEKSASMLSQADLIRLLRITFKGCLGADTALLALVRKLKFDASANASVDITHGRESVGKSINSQIMGVEAIPEEVVLRVPVFENHPFIAAINCAIEVFPHEQCFKVTPYPLQVRKAMAESLDSIESVLAQEDLPPVYRGKP